MSNQQKSMETGRKSTKDENRTDTREAEQNALASPKSSARPHSADWMKYDPDRYDREGLYDVVLTAEQRAQAFDVASRYDNRRTILARYCSPDNAVWIFNVTDALTGYLCSSNTGWCEYGLFALIMGMEFEPVYLTSPRTLRAAITARLNAYYDASPEMMEAVIQSAMIAGEHSDVDITKARIVSEYNGWQDECNDPCRKLVGAI